MIYALNALIITLFFYVINYRLLPRISKLEDRIKVLESHNGISNTGTTFDEFI